MNKVLWPIFDLNELVCRLIHRLAGDQFLKRFLSVILWAQLNEEHLSFWRLEPSAHKTLFFPQAYDK